MPSSPKSSEVRKTLAFYRFCAINDPVALQTELKLLGHKLDLLGTILVAREGVNGTLVGLPDALQQMADTLVERCGEMPLKWSDIQPGNAGFFRFKVKLKEEIVTFGVDTLDLEQTGEHVSAEQWNALLEDPEVLVIDTRNQYEIDIGSFPGAVSPHTTNFRDFPSWVERELDPQEHKHVAMFCTGGIRCEKASAYMVQQGFESVYQLDGGVLKYLEDADSDNNQWQGECFVFDQRVSVDADLQQGNYQQCFACRHPVSQADMEAPEYEPGVSCPHCADAQDKGDRTRFRDRQKQIELARARGETHLGTAQATRHRQS